MLVGAFKQDFYYPFHLYTYIYIHIWDNPSHWRTHIVQDGYKTTNQMENTPFIDDFPIQTSMFLGDFPCFSHGRAVRPRHVRKHRGTVCRLAWLPGNPPRKRATSRRWWCAWEITDSLAEKWGSWLVKFYEMTTRWCPSSLAKLVYKSNFTMVYGRYNYTWWGL